MCVCVRERERDREREKDLEVRKYLVISEIELDDAELFADLVEVTSEFLFSLVVSYLLSFDWILGNSLSLVP
jgi:hypothetical protein